jgi:hypothetical protein
MDGKREWGARPLRVGSARRTVGGKVAAVRHAKDIDGVEPRTDAGGQFP